MIRITTEDNPWNPFTNWDEWYHYDIVNGYQTCEKVDRLAKTSEALPDSENINILNDAYDRLVSLGAISNTGKMVKYKKVYSDLNENKS